MEVAEEFNREYSDYGVITMPNLVDEGLLDRLLGAC